MKTTCPFILIMVALQLACNTLQEFPSLSIDLSGQWQFRFDPQSIGEKDEWYFSKDSLNWRLIQVPGSYNNDFTDAEFYQGKGWYRRTFSIPDNWNNGKILLHFLGIVLRAKVWLNGKYVGENLSPYTEFSLDISKFITTGPENILVIMIDNEIWERAIPDKNWKGWWNYGGITREVLLEYSPNLSIANVRIDPRMIDNGKWNLTVSAIINNTDESVLANVSLALYNNAGKNKWHLKQNVKIPSDGTIIDFTKEFTDIQPWQPDSPALYRLVVSIKSNDGIQHSKSIRFGFRDIQIKGTGLFLNGKPIRIKGISRHEFWSGYGTTVSEIRTRLDLEDIKSLGCNLVRLAHYPQHSKVYDLCDEMGLLVWDEIPAWKTSVENLTDPSVFEDYVKPMLRQMISDHRNHPSVIIWSVGNEFRSDDPKAAQYVEKATQFVKSLDSTRLVTFASDRHLTDMCFDYVDFIAINEYYGWYYGNIYNIGGVLDSLHTKWPDKPILVSEVGSGSVIGWYNPNPGDAGMDYSEDYQIKFLTTHLNQIYDRKRSQFMAGAIIWLYNDFKDPHRIGGGHPPLCNYVNCKGLVTRDRQKKRAFYAVQKFYNNLQF